MDLLSNMKRSLINSLFCVLICTVGIIAFYLIGTEIKTLKNGEARDEAFIYLAVSVVSVLFLSQFLFVLLRERKHQRCSILFFLLKELVGGLFTAVIGYALLIPFRYYNNRRWDLLEHQSLWDDYVENIMVLWIFVGCFVGFFMLIGTIVRAFQKGKPSVRAADVLDENLQQ